MPRQNPRPAGTGSACLKTPTRLFYVTHPKAAKPLLGPFLSKAEAALGLEVMRSPDAVITVVQIPALDATTLRRAEHNANTCRCFLKRRDWHDR